MFTHTKTLKINEKLGFTLAPKDAQGNPATLDGPETFSLAGPNILRVDDPAYMSSVYSIFPTAVGSTSVIVHAISAGVDVSEQINVTVEAVPAATLGLAFQAPQPK